MENKKPSRYLFFQAEKTRLNPAVVERFLRQDVSLGRRMPNQDMVQTGKQPQVATACHLWLFIMLWLLTTLWLETTLWRSYCGSTAVAVARLWLASVAGDSVAEPPFIGLSSSSRPAQGEIVQNPSNSVIN